MSNRDLCLICDRPATTPCPQCAKPLYCSPSCLESDVPSHALLCNAFGVHPLPTTNEVQHVLGILIPSDTTTPKLVHVPISGFSDEQSGISFQEAEVASFFPSNATPQSMHSERNRVRNRDTRSMLEIWHAKDGEENACVQAMALGSGGPFYEWKGPVLVMAMSRSTGFMVDPGAYRDVRLHDFRDATDFLVDYGDDSHERRLKEVLGTLGAGQSGKYTVERRGPEPVEEVKEVKEVKGVKTILIEME